MGTEAENLETVETEIEEEIATPEEEVETAEGEETQPQFTQQQLDDIVSKRVKRLNSKVEDTTAEADAAKTHVALLEEKNKLLELALQQQKETKQAGPPNPDDFDGYDSDPAYIAAKEAYQEKLLDEKVATRIAEENLKAQQEAAKADKARELERKQFEHYKRSQSLEVKDFTEAEDKVIEAMGSEVVNQIIDNFEDSHAIIYRLGKDTAEAERLARLIKTNPIQGVAEIGRIRAELKPSPTKTIPPEPVDPLEGATVSYSKRGPKGATFA